MHTTHNNQAEIYGFVSFANCHLMPTCLASGTFGPAVQKVKTETTDYALSIMRDCIVVKK
jgi:hypothetical protein